MSESSGATGGGSELGAILASASPDARAALIGILRLERDHLPEKNPRAAKLAREIAEIIRKEVT